MRIIDLTPLEKNDTQYERLAASVFEHYKCEWDDAVHDSYGIYVKQVEERSLAVRVIRCKTEALAKEAEGLKIDELVRKAAMLCREAGGI